MKKLTTEQFIEKAKLKHKNKYDYSLVNYKSGRSRIDIICLEHGKFKQIARNHLVGHGCPVCYKESSIITLNDFIDKAKNIHGDKYDYKLVCYKNNRTKVDIICKEHGVFKQIANYHIRGSGCPVCNESKGEKEVAKWLDKNNIKYIRQKRFNDCKNIRSLPFDFYIYSLNMCIEYDGKQHFEAIDFFGGEEGLIYIQNNDRIKTQYCINNNMKLVRIKYSEKIVGKLLFLTKYKHI